MGTVRAAGVICKGFFVGQLDQGVPFCLTAATRPISNLQPKNT